MKNTIQHTSNLRFYKALGVSNREDNVQNTPRSYSFELSKRSWRQKLHT